MPVKFIGHGTRAEIKTSKRHSGRLSPASGALAGAKGDFRIPGFLVENKCTNKKSLSLKQEWLTKISKEAVSENRAPAVAIQFVDDLGNPTHCGKWVAVPERVFLEFLDAVSEEHT